MNKIDIQGSKYFDVVGILSLNSNIEIKNSSIQFNNYGGIITIVNKDNKISISQSQIELNGFCGLYSIGINKNSQIIDCII